MADNDNNDGNGALPVESKDQRRARLREIAGRVSKMTDEQRADLASRVSIVTIEGRSLSPHQTQEIGDAQ